MQDNPSGAPIFFKWVALLTVVTGIVSVFTDVLNTLLGNYPFYTLLYVNLWRPFSCALVSSGFFTSIGSVMAMFFVMPELERSISTAITFADFFISNAIVQLTYCLLWLALYIASDEYAGDMHSSGLWVMWMIYAVRISESDLGGSIQPCCLPIRIKKRLYPLLAMLLLGVAQWQFPYDLVVAYVVGVVACRMFDGSFIKLTNNAYKRLETSFLLSWMSQRDDFCTISSSPKSQFFCADSIHNYKEFYANFMTKASDDGQDPAPDTIPGGPAQGFNEVNGMSTGPVIARNIVSLDDIRNHWTTKDAEEDEAEAEKAAEAGPTTEKDDLQKSIELEKDLQGSYSTFNEETEK